MGLKVVEISLATPGALDVVRDVSNCLPPGAHIGVGTVLTSSDVESAARAGASFVVSPISRAEVIRASIDRGLEVLPGAATPTEVVEAQRLGARLIKLFPASLWSPSALRDMLTALPDVEAVPTGGISERSAGDWIAAGATALGIGGSLTSAKDLPEAVRRFNEVIREAAR